MKLGLFFTLFIYCLPALADSQREAALISEAEANFKKMADVVFANEHSKLEILESRASNYVAQLKNIENEMSRLYAEQKALNLRHDPRDNTFPDVERAASDSPIRKKYAAYQALADEISVKHLEKKNLEVAIIDEKKQPGSAARSRELHQAREDLKNKMAALKAHGPGYLEKNFWAAEGPRVDGLDHSRRFELTKEGKTAYADYEKWLKKFSRSSLGQRALKRLGLAGAIVSLGITAAQAAGGGAEAAPELKASDFSKPRTEEPSDVSIGVLESE